MRLKIELRPQTKTFSIPINYNYPLAAAIYKLLFIGSKEFSEWLHNSGYINSEGKPIKLFTFSKIIFEEIKLTKNIGIGKGNCFFYLSSPITEKHIKNLIQGIMENPKFEIGNSNVVARFQIKKINIAQEPLFDKIMYYKMISPTVVTTMKLTDKGLQVYYCRPDDNILIKGLKENLKRKYELLFKKKYNDLLHIELDKEYIFQQGGYNNITKLITIKEGKPDETKVKTFVCPLTIKAHPDMQKIAYDCGIGNKNSMGFGMIEAFDKEEK